MRIAFTLVFCALLTSSAIGQRGDKRGEEQNPLPSHWIIPPAPILSPDEELKTFQLAEEDCVVELFASEPMVQDPVAMEFDERGRLWVVEMRGYMQTIDGRGERDPIGRISILEDSDRDGRADRSTVFLDKLILPRAIHVCNGGALVAYEEKLWFAKDTDGDNVADVREVVDEDYIKSGNPEHQPNGLLRGMDNWIYSAKSDQRYRLVDGSWIKQKTEFRGQWGITESQWGRIYYNVNYSQLHGDLFPPNYSLRNTNFTTVHAINRQITTNQTIFTLRPNTGVNRAYRPGILDESGHLREFTSACAPHAYGDELLFKNGALGKQFDVFVCDPAANLVKRNRVMTFSGGDACDPAYPDREFLVSTDERFRPVWLATAPDGALLVADMYRGINQHRQYMTTHLRREILSRDLDQGIHCGRIWRIRPRDRSLRKAEPLLSDSPEQWLQALYSPNHGLRNRAQQLIVESGRLELVPRLLKIESNASQLFTGMHALWAVEGLLAMDDDGAVAYRQMADDDWAALLNAVEDDIVSGAVALRIAAMTARGNIQRESDLIDLVTAWFEKEPNFPWYHAALVLGDLQHAEAYQLVLENLHRRPDVPILREAALSGLGDRELQSIEWLLERWPTYERDRDIVLQEFAGCVARRGDAKELARLLALASEQVGDMAWRQLPMLNGLLANRNRLARDPVRLEREPTAFLKIAETADPLTKASVDSIVAVTSWPGHEVEPVRRRQLRPLRAAEAVQFAEGRKLYGMACAPCHGLAGGGVPSLAPPLMDSEWVSQSPERVAHVVIHGLEGPIEVNGRTYQTPGILPNMPAVDSLTDTEIAAVVSFVVREFGNRNVDFDGMDVTILKNNSTRTTPWTAEELLEHK